MKFSTLAWNAGSLREKEEGDGGRKNGRERKAKKENKTTSIPGYIMKNIHDFSLSIYS